MKKINITYDKKFNIDELIYETSKLVSYPVSIHNLNKTLVMLNEDNNCKSCKSIDNCKNTYIGYRTIYENESFKLIKCPYKVKYDKEFIQNQNFKTLYMDIDLGNFDIKDFIVNENNKFVYDKVISFIKNFNENISQKGLYIHGKNGCGKTFLMACMCNVLKKHNIKSFLVYMPDFVRQSKGLINDSEKLEILINRLKDVDILIFDDIGAENMTKWFRDEIFGSIINHRVIKQKPIFFTSNYSTERLANHLNVDDSKNSELYVYRLLSKISKISNMVEIK